MEVKHVNKAIALKIIGIFFLAIIFLNIYNSSIKSFAFPLLKRFHEAAFHALAFTRIMRLVLTCLKDFYPKYKEFFRQLSIAF